MIRRGFTLIELMVAGMMASIVLGGITTSLSQLGSAKSVSRQRLEAFSRCDTALRTVRKEIISVLRRADLFNTRVLITDSTGRFQGEQLHRDELLLFNGNVRANKEIDFNGEGLEYETQFRIEDNDISSALWKRRDAILDDNPVGGGMVIPIADGVVSLQLEAFDGLSWSNQWDSDELGVPHAIRISITATGMEFEGDKHAPLITLRTIVPLDRVRSPLDKLIMIADQEAEEQGLGEFADNQDGEDALATGGDGTGDGVAVAGNDGIAKDPNAGSGRDPGTGTAGGASIGATEIKGGTTITDPDGNVHEIPPPP